VFCFTCVASALYYSSPRFATRVGQLSRLGCQVWRQLPGCKVFYKDGCKCHASDIVFFNANGSFKAGQVLWHAEVDGFVYTKLREFRWLRDEKPHFVVYQLGTDGLIISAADILAPVQALVEGSIVHLLIPPHLR